MKYLFALIVSLFIMSCVTKKQTIKTENNTSETVSTESNITESSTIIEQPESQNETVVESEEDIIPLPPKPPKPLSNYKDVMHNRWNKILQNHVSESGNVNYKGIKNESEFEVYIDYLSETLPDDSWTKDEKLAYWINAYNALTVDLILRHYPVKSIKDIKDPWDQRLWQFGDKWQNLNDIEHKILREMNEPRIHFAIVCASISCPKLQNEAFTASDLETQLTNATKEFLNDSTKNELTENHIKLSKIFKWFKKDFEHDGDLIEFLNQNADLKISSSAKKSFKDYNWNLND
ncbi:DUF547 domain-containing protein [Winogradskyella eckloniae]|uniref:DUF547 domain-containing protein n=1 Tax=Winogradskyella eckloniae TaxID=1089306 RepID=UPI001564BBA9|nr:DUF547 domain-containing protein [Winogradskyella eckloniae]NRD19282.1 DUF547 domain-containing protein [Winogradskyella eckloniae]